jgi:hypothetical protein
MVAKLARTTTHTQQNTQHIRINMSCCHPTLQQLHPLSPWIGQRRPQIIVPPLSMDPLQAPSAGFTLTRADSLVWGNKTRNIKKQREGGGVGLRWPLLGQKSNNQQIVGRNDGRDDGEAARLGQRVVWGVLSLRAGQQIKQHKKCKN